MAEQHLGVLNPVPLSPGMSQTYWEKYLRDFNLSYDGDDYDTGDYARFDASLHIASQPKPTLKHPINYASSVALAAYWHDGFDESRARAQYIFDLDATVQHYAGQSVVWVRRGDIKSLDKRRHTHSDIELDIARINTLGDAKVGHITKLLTPEQQAATKHPDIEQISYRALFGVVQLQRVVRTAGKLVVKELHLGQNTLPAIVGRISMVPHPAPYHQVRQDSRMTLAFGNNAAYEILQSLTKSVGGDAYHRFEQAAKSENINRLEPMPNLDFLTAPDRPKPVARPESIEDLLADMQSRLH